MKFVHVFEGGDEPVFVKERDLAEYRKRFPKAEESLAFDVDGKPVFVRARDVGAFKQKHGGKAEPAFGVEVGGEPVFVRERDRAAFAKTMGSAARAKAEAAPASGFDTPWQGFKEGALRGARDVGLSAAKGVASVPGAVVGVADLVTAPLQAGLSKLAYGEAQTGLIGGVVEEATELLAPGLNRVGSTLDAAHSEEFKADREKVNAAEGFKGTAAAILKNPHVAGSTVVESVAPMLLGGGIGNRLAKAAPKLAGVAGSIGEGLAAGGSLQEQFRAGRGSGTTTPAQSALAAGAGLATGAIGAASNRLGSLVGASDVEAVAAGVAKRGVKAATRAERALRGIAGVGMEAAEEMLQEPGEGIAENLGTGRPWDEGLKNRAVQGGVAGAAMGLGANVDLRRGPVAERVAAARREGTPDPLLEDSEAGKAARLAAMRANRPTPPPEMPPTMPQDGPAAPPPVIVEIDGKPHEVVAENPAAQTATVVSEMGEVKQVPLSMVPPMPENVVGAPPPEAPELGEVVPDADGTGQRATLVSAPEMIALPEPVPPVLPDAPPLDVPDAPPAMPPATVETPPQAETPEMPPPVAAGELPSAENVTRTKKPAVLSEAGKALEEILYTERPTVELPVKDIAVQSPGFEQFKQDADPKTGEVSGQELKGRVVDLDAKPIVVLMRLDGSQVVVTGRHRLGLYKRNGRTTIPAKVLYEAEGVTPTVAHAIDAISNILDEKGTINDYVRFFDETQISDDEAQPLLDRPSPRAAYSIYRDSSQVTRDAVDWEGEGRNGISAEQAAIISRNAPISQNQGFAGAQVLGVKAARNGMKGKLLDGYMQAIVRNELMRQRNKAAGAAPQAMDLFAGTQWDIGDAESIAAKEAKYTSGKAAEYATLRSVLSSAMKKAGRLVLTDSQAQELGITDKADKAQIAAAWQKAKELADYWSKGNLDVDDIIEMRKALGLSTEGLVPSQDFALNSPTEAQLDAEQASARNARTLAALQADREGPGRMLDMEQAGLPGIGTDTPLFNQPAATVETPPRAAEGGARFSPAEGEGGGVETAARGAKAGAFTNRDGDAEVTVSMIVSENRDLPAGDAKILDEQFKGDRLTWVELANAKGLSSKTRTRLVSTLEASDSVEYGAPEYMAASDVKLSPDIMKAFRGLRLINRNGQRGGLTANSMANARIVIEAIAEAAWNAVPAEDKALLDEAKFKDGVSSQAGMLLETPDLYDADAGNFLTLKKDGFGLFIELGGVMNEAGKAAVAQLKSGGVSSAEAGGARFSPAEGEGGGVETVARAPAPGVAGELPSAETAARTKKAKAGGGVTPEMDAAYLAAVEAGDEATAQRMVDEAYASYSGSRDENGVWNWRKSVKAAGYRIGNIPAAGKSFNARDNSYEDGISLIGVGTLPKVNSFAISARKDGGDNIVYVFGDVNITTGGDDEFVMKNPRVITKQEFDLLIRSESQKISEKVLAEHMWNVIGNHGGYPENAKKWKNEFISRKLDAVTLDDSGRVIPLSERFNPKNDDVRFSPAEGEGGGVETGTRAPAPGVASVRRGTPQGAAGGKLNGKPRIGLRLGDVVEFAVALANGKAPRVVERIRGLGGRAAGVFKPNADGTASIDIRADQALVVGTGERAALMAETSEQVQGELGERPGVEDADARAEWDARAREVFKEKLDEAFARNVQDDPEQAMKVMAHEVGHWVDWLPDNTLKRGNVFGHIAALLGYTKQSMGMDPRSPGPLTEGEKNEMMKRARREVGRGRERVIIEEIVREVPEYKIIGIKPSDVTSLLGTDAGKSTPELYAWFAAQDTQTKKEILKAAIKGAVDPRLDQFGKKVQTGTRIQKETKVTKVVPTEEDVRKRFRELLAEEVAARRLAELAVVKKELESLIAWYNNSESMPEYYRDPAEMFAEAFSAWVNYPAEVAARAPIFNSLVEEWIAARPEAYAHYAAIQKKLETPGMSEGEQVRKLEEGFERARRDAELAARARERVGGAELSDRVLAFFHRTMDPIYRRVARLKDTARAAETLKALADQRYWGADAERITTKVGERVVKPLQAAGVSITRFNTFLAMRRIANEGVNTMVDEQRKRGRANLFNPFGFTPRSAGAWLKAHGEKFPESLAAMEAAAGELVAIRREVLFPILKASGAVSEKTYEMLLENWAYAKFKVNQHGELKSALERMMGVGEGGSGLKTQRGTLREIGGPLENTVLADIAMARWALTQNANWRAIQDIMATTPEDVKELRPQWVAGKPVWPAVNTPRMKTVHVTRLGVDHAFAVPTAIARALGKRGDESVVSVLAARLVQGQARLLTTWNLGFALRNPFRDYQRAARLLPGWFYLPVIGNPQLLWRVFANLPASVRRARGLSDPRVDEALKRHMLVAGSGSYSTDSWYGAEDDVSKAVRNSGLGMRAAANKGLEAGRRALDLLGVVTKALQLSETAVKLASMQYLDAKFPAMPEHIKQRMVQRYGGTPDVLERSMLGSSPAARMALLFYNINKEGLVNAVEVARERPIEQAYKAAVGAIPAIATSMAAYGAFSAMLRELAGAFDDDDEDDDEAQEAKHGLALWADQVADWETMQKSVPFRDRMLYNATAFAWTDKEQGKVAYVRFMDDPMNGAVRAMTLGALEAAQGRVSVFDALDIGVGDQTPNLSPFASLGVALLTGKDAAFGWRDIVSDPRAINSPEGRKQNLKEYAKWTYNNISGGTLGLYRIQPDRDPAAPPPGALEEKLKTAGLGTLASSFVRVSNAGLREQFRKQDAEYEGWLYDNTKLADRWIEMQESREEIPEEMQKRRREIPPARWEQMLTERRNERNLKSKPLDVQRRKETRNRPRDFR